MPLASMQCESETQRRERTRRDFTAEFKHLLAKARPSEDSVPLQRQQFLPKATFFEKFICAVLQQAKSQEPYLRSNYMFAKSKTAAQT